MKVKGEWEFLYRAVDKQGQTIDFYLSHTRNWLSAVKFFKKALKQSHATEPHVINTDQNAAYLVAMNDLQYMEHLSKECKLRQVKYLNNCLESEYRFNLSRILFETRFKFYCKTTPFNVLGQTTNASQLIKIALQSIFLTTIHD